MDDELTQVHRFIVDCYNLEELRTLCFHLGAKYDNLAGETLDGKARELILYLGRARQIDRLLSLLQEARAETFVQAGLDTDQGFLDALYAELPAFETLAPLPLSSVSMVGNLRAKERVYLDALLKQYDYWLDHYTPLAGIAEVRAAVADGPRLDLPMPFIPRGFEKLVEHGFGERGEVKREPVDDLREAIREQRRIVLLGDPGSGKTTTLWRLAYDCAQAAKEDEGAPLPVFVPLGGYTGDDPFDAYLAHRLGALAPHVDAYRASGRLILLLDGLNEMPQTGYRERVGRVREALDRYPDETVVVTCRALDYVVKLEDLLKIEVSPLDPVRMRTFLHNYLGEVAGERLCWELLGSGEARELWETWQGAGGTWEAFWTAEEMPKNVYNKTTIVQDDLWKRLREEPPQLLSLGGNPYMLLMTAQV